MGWLFGRKRDAGDANEILRRYNEAEAERLAAMTAAGTRSGLPSEAGAPLSAGTSATEFVVEDVFTITGRGTVVTGKVSAGLLRVDDEIIALRDGLPGPRTRIAGIEMFRRRADEAKPGGLVGLLLAEKIPVGRGDVIRFAASV